MDLKHKIFDLEKYDEAELEKTVRGLRPGSKVTLKGSGAGVVARGGGVRMFTLSVPSAAPRRPVVSQASLKSAKEATKVLLSVHQQILGTEVVHEDVMG